MLVERVLAVQEDGLELEFDHPVGTSIEDRQRDWQFPARVFRAQSGELTLLNEAELEQRISDWLQRAELDRSACGQWIFTWTAVKIECDPESVLETLEPFNLQVSGIKDNLMYEAFGAAGRAPLELQASAIDDRVFVARFEIDRETVRRERAQADIALAQMLGEPELSFEEAMQDRPIDSIEGSLTVTIHADSDGRVTRRVREIALKLDEPMGFVSDEFVTQTATRTLISGTQSGG